MKFTDTEYDAIYNYYRELKDGLQHYMAIWREVRCPGNFPDWAIIHCPWIMDDLQEIDRLKILSQYLLDHPEKAYDDFSDRVIDRPIYVRPAFYDSPDRLPRGKISSTVAPDFDEMHENTRVRGAVVPGTYEWDYLASDKYNHRLQELIQRGEPISRRAYLDHVYGPGVKYSEENWVPAPLCYLGRSIQSKKSPPTPVVTRWVKEPYNEEALVETVRVLRERIRPDWEALLEEKHPRDFRPRMYERGPEIGALFEDYAVAEYECEKIYHECAARTVGAWCEYLVEDPGNENAPTQAYVDWVGDRFPKIHFAVRRLSVVAQTAIQGMLRVALEVQSRNFLDYYTRARYIMERTAMMNNDVELMEVLESRELLSRERVIRTIFRGIPNSWSIGHEQMLPFLYRDYSRFAHPPLNADGSLAGPIRLSGPYTEEYMLRSPIFGKNFEVPGTAYVPHETVTQEVPEGCWWV